MVRLALIRQARQRTRITRSLVQEVSARTVHRTGSLRYEAGQAVRDAVAGAVKAVNEIRGEAGAFTQDAVIGVLRGTSETTRLTAPAVRNAVIGGIRSSIDAGVGLDQAGRETVAGAIRGAVEAGLDADEAVTAASRGALEAVQDSGEDVGRLAGAVIRGVIEGIEATGGDVAEAIFGSSRDLTAAMAPADEDTLKIAQAVIQTAAHSAGSEAGLAAAAGAAEAAYAVSRRAGNRVRRASLETIRSSPPLLGAEIEERFRQYTKEITRELERGRGAWRIQALWEAVTDLVRVGALDLAGSLAFFTLLSLFPLATFSVLVLTLVADAQTTQAFLTDFFLRFFPASQEFLDAAIPHLFQEQVLAGVVALVTIVAASNGLFMAANRAINRVFGSSPRKLLSATVAQVGLVALLVTVFLATLGLSVVFQILVSVSDMLADAGIPIDRPTLFITSAASIALDVVLTTAAFTFMYRTLPSVDVRYRDATFGAIIAVLLFEAARYISIILGGIATSRSAIYGPASSVVILLSWSFIAGLIFLYGAAVCNQATRLRPRDNGRVFTTADVEDTVHAASIQ